MSGSSLSTSLFLGSTKHFLKQKYVILNNFIKKIVGNTRTSQGSIICITLSIFYNPLCLAKRNIGIFSNLLLKNIVNFNKKLWEKKITNFVKQLGKKFENVIIKSQKHSEFCEKNIMNFANLLLKNITNTET